MRWAALPLAVLSGALVALSFPDFELWPLAWVAFVPLLAGLERSSPARSFLLGWIAGLVAHLVGFYWIAGPLVRFGGLPLAAAVPLYFLYCAWGGCGLGLTAGLGGLAAGDGGRGGEGTAGMLLVFPLAFVAGEHLFPAVFPWNLAGGQYRFLPFIQAAEVVGALGLGGMLAAGSSALWAAVAMASGRARSSRRRWAGVAAIVLGLAAVIAGGALRIRAVERLRLASPAVRVGVVQPNIGILDKGDRSKAAAQVALLGSLTRKAVAAGAEAVIWPETSYPYPIRRDLREGDDRAGRAMAGFTVPVVFGAVTRDAEGRWNSAFVALPGGILSAPVDKKHLVPGSEGIPLRDSVPREIRRKVPFLSGGFRPGSGPAILSWGDVRAGILNCFEDTIPGRSREAVAAGSNLLLNLTNDAWFGDTSEPTEHLALAVLRTVENRRDMVRSVNTGVSAFVEATGRVDMRTSTFTRASVVVTARLLESRTFYTFAGDWVGWAAMAALALAIAWTRIGSRMLERPK